MNIEKLLGQNFLALDSISIELDNRGLLLIQGENSDDPSADSNGSGKSSIPDLLCWTLYGVTARGVSGDAVVNKTAKKDCFGSVILRDQPGDDFVYMIQRFRKHSTGKNQLLVTKVNAGAASVDLSKGTDKETQEVVNQIMGCSLDVFMAAVYAGQERMPDLPGMTDKMLKTLIEEAAGVEVLTEAYANARNRYGTAKSYVDNLLSTRVSATANVSYLNDEVARLKKTMKDFEDGRRDRAKAELAKILPLNKEIATAEEALKTWNETEVREQLAICEVKIDSHKAEQAELNRLTAEYHKAELAQSKARRDAEEVKRIVDQREKALADIDNRVGKPCGECGKLYRAEDLATARTTQEEQIAKAKASLRPLLVELKKAIESEKIAANAAATFKGSMTDITAVAQRQRELSNLLNAIDATKRSIEAKRKEVVSIKNAANLKLTETNPWTMAVETKREEVKRADLALAEVTVKIEESSATLELLADAVKVFGPAGVRAHVLDTVTPYLNDRTRDYLGALADGNIHATWATLTKTAKGELKEKFNIEVVNDKGAENFAGLSGGEKRKVRLATAMALQDMVASRATKPINIFIADEVDHALDESGLERLMGVLERKARERGTVLVISHNSLSDWISEVITVTKTAGIATVSGATERGF
jgi:DNA repair exonuclease SbcCD ATPase subunit